jgi:hypothetical protein
VLLGTLFVDAVFGVGTVTDVLRPLLGENISRVPRPDLFEAIACSEADVGRTFVVSSDDPDFGPVVARLTNGVDDEIAVVLRAGPGASIHAGPESRLIQGTAGPPAPDFVGSTITRIELRLEALSLDVPGRNPNGDGIFTDIAVILRVEFFGVR